LGVLMALALQQWAENVAWSSRTSEARSAIRQELRNHYFNAVEWRMFAPCVTAQLERIEHQVLESPPRLQPIAIHRLDKTRTAVVRPSRIYDDSAWVGTVSEGTAFRLTDLEREILANEYWLAGKMDKLGEELDESDSRLLAATKPLELDPEVRFSLLQAIDKMHAASERMTDSAGEIIFWIGKFGAAPAREDVAKDLDRNSGFGRQFCGSEHLPTRTLVEAIDPNL
jgi:hypothetical protein